MSFKNRFAADMAGPCGARWLAILSMLVGFSLASTALAADDFLNQIESEAMNLEAGTPGEAGDSLATVDGPIVENSTRKQFETMLSQRYAGTYRFFAKLPERSRQEVFESYRGGADIEGLRKKIIDRLYSTSR